MSVCFGRRSAWYGATAIMLASACPSAHAQSSQAAAPADPASAPFDPGSDLAPLPGLGLEWPDLSATDTKEQAAASPTEAERRYTYRIDGIESITAPLLHQRFKELSALAANDKQAANVAQIDRRAREDVTLLTTLLRAEGYYDAEVSSRAETGSSGPVVVLDVEPGSQYNFGGVEITGIEAAGAQASALRAAFGVNVGDPFNADKIAAGEANLRSVIADRGFPFAIVGAPEVVIDHAEHRASLAMTVTPGGERRFGRVTTPLAPPPVFSAGHIEELARFKPGDMYNATDIADLRRTLIQTGLVSEVEIKPVDSAAPGLVDISVALSPAPPRTIAGEVGYGTGEGARAEVSWTHRNLFPPEGALTLRGVAGTREQLASAIYRRNNFKGRDRVLTVQATASNLTRNAYQATTVSLLGSLERQTNIFFQKKWVWSLGAELTASDERDVIVSTGAPRRRTYFITALPTSLSYDGSDDLLNPARGFRLSGRLSPELSLEGRAFGYARIQIDGSAYKSFGTRFVLAGRMRLGTIAGAPRDAIAPSRRFYAGGGASVRGYGYQAIGPRDPNNDPIGGRSLSEFSLEGRVKAFGNFGVVPFLDGGNIYTSALPKFSSFRYGAGIGLRYYSNFGPIRIDVGTPINPQTGDPRVAVYVSLGQAF